MAIFSKLLRNTVSNIGYKIGMFAPLFVTYIIGTEIVDILSKRHNVDKSRFKIAWKAIHYGFLFIWISIFFKGGYDVRKLHMIDSRKC